jgi:branched-chain amino acid transport system substrate-binding protein
MAVENLWVAQKSLGSAGDSTCVDSAAAQATAERLVTSDKVNAIMGADCSGVTGRDPRQRCNGKWRGHDLAIGNFTWIYPQLRITVFSFARRRSDARQGQVVAEILKDQGFMNAAITYYQ